MAVGEYWDALSALVPTLIRNGVPTGKLLEAAGIDPSKAFPDWMNAPALTTTTTTTAPSPVPMQYLGAKAMRLAFGSEPAPAPKPKKPAGPPILPLDTPRRFFED